MVHFYGLRLPCLPYRWQRGLLLLCRARRLIPTGFRDLAASCANDPLPEPVGQAYSC
jgi:hypothetical protein